MNNIINERTVKQILKVNKLEWFGYVVRMNEERPEKQVWEAEIHGKKRRESPHKAWNVTVANYFNLDDARRTETSRRQ